MTAIWRIDREVRAGDPPPLTQQGYSYLLDDHEHERRERLCKNKRACKYVLDGWAEQ